MKKFAFIIFVICACLTLTACKENKAPENTASLRVDESLDFKSYESDSTDYSSQEMAEKTTDGGRIGKRTEKFVKMMESGQYRLQFETIVMENEVEYTTSYDIALSNGRLYFKTSTNRPDDNSELPQPDSITIFNNGKIYAVNPIDKSYIETDGTIEEAGLINIDGIRFLENSREGRVEYEEYSTESGGTVRFYISDDMLLRFYYVTEERNLDGENATMTTDVPESLFNIPSDYRNAG